jgi:lysozyme
MNKQRLMAQLREHEGLRLKPYHCTAGKLTIGIGRNLESVGLREDEAIYMLNNDINETYEKLRNAWPKIILLDDARQNVMINMAFNIGVAGLMKFSKMLNALALTDYEQAAKEMLDSKWADQVGERAVKLAMQMRTGQFQ